ncbi:Saposin B-type domain-containing protein [Caenorhabditis elegans]|uniref:Saposin B-type domain-containing protein n=2 Tax=Caenorhabditis elegans TaxID=6239 RepID=Q19837_CAEEL|nr:Saposin B-type domain-containing protein [Caenorhabditis elegans]CAA92462.1 Saposin B-type domain-containing protein [Caenorhabditis elegans]|eukprot:NP_501704.1 SaPosin-like Protein family [Caenorhabditis elegans]
MKTSALAFLALVCASSAFVVPQNADQCGAVDITKMAKRYVPSQNSDATCEICLDLVLIAETYAECDEAIVQHHMDAYCVEHVKNHASQALCKLLIDDIAHAVIEDTDQNPTGVCQKVIHKTCPYNN